MNEIDQQITEMAKQTAEMLNKGGVKNTPFYKLFLKIKAQEALYLDPEIHAARGASSLKDEIHDPSDEQLSQLAKIFVDNCNALYTQLYEDLHQDKQLTNLVFSTMLKG